MWEQYQLLEFVTAISHKYSDKHKFILDLMLLETPKLLVGPIQDDFKQFLRGFISTNNLKGDLLELLYSLMVSFSCNNDEYICHTSSYRIYFCRMYSPYKFINLYLESLSIYNHQATIIIIIVVGFIGMVNS